MKNIPTLEEFLNESKYNGYEGQEDSAEDIIRLIEKLPNSIHSLTIPTSIKDPIKNKEIFDPSRDKNWKIKAVDLIKKLSDDNPSKIRNFVLKSHFGKGGSNEPYYMVVNKK